METLPINQIIHGDSKEVLKKIPDNTIDTLITDPPYGINFLNHGWDEVLPNKEIWKESLRVLKPGAFAFVFCIPRADCMYRMIQDLENAGFKVAFTPMFWAFASGMPKATNMGLAIDKKEGVKSKIIGKNPHTSQNFSNCTFLSEKARQNKRIRLPILEPSSTKGKEFNGAFAGFQPKPAIEVIIVAMKSLEEKTYIEQALKNGKGVTFLGDCKIPTEENLGRLNPEKSPTVSYGGGNLGTGPNKQYGKPIGTHKRFPANLIVQDNILNCSRITKSVGGRSGNNKAYSGGYGGNFYGNTTPGLKDEGDFSRYFSLDRWWENKIKELPQAVQKTFPFIIVNKTQKKEKEKGCENIPLKDKNERHNTHPTIKPIKLISYLITMGSRENDIILDPFIGSGTTAISAMLLDRKYIGIEKESAYVAITLARIEAVKAELKLS